MKMIRLLNTVFLIIIILVNLSFSQPKIVSVESVGITVSDLEVILPFYTNVLHFEILSDDTINCSNYSKLMNYQNSIVRIAKLKLGNEKIKLIDFINDNSKPFPNDSRSNDLWFQHIAIITSNMDRAYKWLMNNKVNKISEEPQRLPDWNKIAGGIKAFYFKDPDGHPLEILEFPTGKGNKKWHKKTKKLFLGIDHTAIAVSNTEESLKFYQNILGMRVGGKSENYGIEQSKLNNVADAHLEITGLITDSGPGIEFLEYLSPRNGRSYPSDAKSTDLIHWVVEVSIQGSIDSLYSKIITKGYKTYSTVMNEFDQRHFNSAFIVLDPNGHRLLITK